MFSCIFFLPVHVSGYAPQSKFTGGQGPTGRERRKKKGGSLCKSSFRRGKAGWMGRGEERERAKGQRGNIFSLCSPSFLFSSCEGQAWRGCGLAQRLCTAPRGASHRNPINHWSRSLTPGHKDLTHTHTRTHAHTHTHPTCQHTNRMSTCMFARACKASEEKQNAKRRGWRFLSAFSQKYT